MLETKYPIIRKIYRQTLLVGLIVVLVSGLAGCGSPSAEQPAVPVSGMVIGVASELLDGAGNPQVGQPAPDFAYTLDDGSTHQLSDLRGQKVLLNFWATWCPPCNAEMPDIEEASRRFRDADLVVLAVNHSEPVDAITAFGQEMGLTFPLIANQSGDISAVYVERGLPTSFFINTDGTISYKQVGPMDLAFIQQRLEDMQ